MAMLVTGSRSNPMAHLYYYHVSDYTLGSVAVLKRCKVPAKGRIAEQRKECHAACRLSTAKCIIICFVAPHLEALQ